MMRCYDAMVRTTVNLDDDVLETARSIAAAEHRSLGGVLSELARRGLAPRPVDFGEEDGFPVFSVDPRAGAITPDMVRAALEEP